MLHFPSEIPLASSGRQLQIHVYVRLLFVVRVWCSWASVMLFYTRIMMDIRIA